MMEEIKEINEEVNGRIVIFLPANAMVSTRDRDSLIRLPESIIPGGYVYSVPNSFIKVNKKTGDLKIYAYKDFVFHSRSELLGKTFSFSPSFLLEKSIGLLPSDYKEGSGDISSYAIKIPKEAILGSYETVYFLKMPYDGKFAGCTYYLNRGFVRPSGNSFYLILKEDYNIRLSKKSYGKEEEIYFLTREELRSELIGKSPGSYIKKNRNETYNKLKENLFLIPEELRKNNSWVAMRVKKDNEGKERKILLTPKMGESIFAKSDDPSTWGTFIEAENYAKNRYCQSLAYALSNKDRLSVIDIDDCIDEKGNLNDKAQKVLDASNGTYAEVSVSGKGVHILVYSDDLKLKSFSKDGSLELYQKSHFIGLTGNLLSESNVIKEIKDTELSKILEENFEKRNPPPEKRGIQGLSEMSDREIIEKAGKSRTGEKFVRLYAGEDLKGNQSNSDMALMNILAFWCNGDSDQMIRIFSTSGLYRPKKPAAYYEHTARKAIENVRDRYNRQVLKKNPINLKIMEK